jgi:lipoprotein-anchoring transpeptidase ErfK/SrfK
MKASTAAMGETLRGMMGASASHARRQRMRARSALASVAVLLCLGLALTGCATSTPAQSAATAMAGAQVSQIPSPTPGAMAKSTAPAHSIRSCAKPVGKAKMLAAKDLSQPFVFKAGDLRSCLLLNEIVPAPSGSVPTVSGQLILVNLTQQWLWAYDSGRLLMASPVTTGMPYLWTPQGTFPVRDRVRDTMFYSPWPPSSPWYYTPEHVNYALFFRDKGFYIHDAPWRRYFGPGTEVPHTNPDGTQETGSHGCVNMPTPAGQWLYNWAQLGATIVIDA